MKTVNKILKLFGYKEHICTNCQKTNYFKGGTDFESIAGFCRKCDHPVWYVILFFLLFSSCKTTNIYIIDITENKEKTAEVKENRFAPSFIDAESIFNEKWKNRQRK